ncbi:ABC transporter substrate-binding protein [Eremococcus coleocola]|uniref:ABC transporter substrate-binding protein n=1 Tax=Eremococcus coleocola TaxID=88132 RepID=UPI000427BAD0|nr:ABC transporter substrate-binding protein [Eremococcus coleocola]
MSYKKLVQFGLVMLVYLLVGGQTALAAQSIKIGGNYELSGAAAAYGQAMKDGLDLAIDQVNQNGGLLDGQLVEAVVYDNKSDLTESASVAQRLVTEGVVGIVGPATTGNAQAEIPLITKGQLPTVLPAATGDTITLDDQGKVLDYLFRVCFADSYQGIAAAGYAHDQLKAQKAAVVVDTTSDYATGLADNFKAKFQALGGQVVLEDSMAAGDVDFSVIITKLLNQDVDVIYMPTYYTEAGLFIHQARELGIQTPILGGDGYSSQILTQLASNEYANEIYYTDHFSLVSEDKTVQDFIQAFKDKYGKEPGAFEALGYDAAMVLMDAIERVGTTEPQAVKEALAQTKDYHGVTGTFTMDENHNPLKTAIVVQLEEGQVVAADNYEVSDSKSN